MQEFDVKFLHRKAKQLMRDDCGSLYDKALFE